MISAADVGSAAPGVLHPFADSGVPSPPMSPLAAYLVETLVTLLGVIVLAVLVLYAARRLGVGKPAGPLALVGKLPLDGRRAIYLVRVGQTVFVVGASEAGLSKLGELSDEGLDISVDRPPAPAFADVLARVVAKKGNGPTDKRAALDGARDGASTGEES